MKKLYLLIAVHLLVQGSFANTDNRLSIGTKNKQQVFYNNDAQVVIIYSMAQFPANLLFGEVHGVSAVIRNAGVLSLSNLVVNLTVTGINSFTNSKTITSLLPGDSVLVNFNGFTINAVGTNNIVVSVPPDDDNTNNTAYFTQQASPGTFSYADEQPPAGSFFLSPGNSAGSMTMELTAATSGGSNAASLGSRNRAVLSHTYEFVWHALSRQFTNKP